jgi:hypothetical protein
MTRVSDFFMIDDFGAAARWSSQQGCMPTAFRRLPTVATSAETMAMAPPHLCRPHCCRDVELLALTTTDEPFY